MFVMTAFGSTFTLPDRSSALADALLQVGGTLEEVLCSFSETFSQLRHGSLSERRA